MNLVYSALQGTNADLFPEIVKLYIPKNSCVADVTYGKGVFWKNINKNDYTLFTSDIKNGIDMRSLPYDNESMDAVVIDPPYMHTPGGTAHQFHQNYEKYYANNETQNKYDDIKYHDAILRLYFDGIDEASRVLKKNGVIIIKCQDQVCAGHMRLASVELAHFLIRRKWYIEDLFVLIANNKPGVSRMKKQKHSRRNHSYFIVARKKNIPKLAMNLDKNLFP